VRERAFLKRLQAELPGWVARGWLSPENSRAILDEVAARAASPAGFLASALGVLGAVLLGAGVITFFAANWGLIPKAAKLALLFGALWAAHAAAGWMLARDRASRIGQALLLLGVMLFGANIMLIAQIYHIDAHYPDGVLTWALGALLAGWLLHSQPAMTAALALAALWTAMEGFDFERTLHWPYLLFLLAALPAVVLRRWPAALQVALAGLLLWSAQALTSVHRWGAFALPSLVQLYFLLYLALFLGALLLERREALAWTAPPLRRYAGFAALGALFLLTFPQMAEGGGWRRAVAGEAAPAAWAALTVGAMALAAGLAARASRRAAEEAAGRRMRWGWAILAAVSALMLLNLFAPGLRGAVAILYNLVFFAGLVWVIAVASERGDRDTVNMAFAFFAVGLVVRYLDTFWTLMGRSYFFMGGGLLLLAGGYLLERQRRRITRGMAGRGSGEGR
jgi:uncharacterized membrane protein